MELDYRIITLDSLIIVEQLKYYTKKTGDRGGWKRLADEAVKSCRQHLSSDNEKKGRYFKVQGNGS